MSERHGEEKPRFPRRRWLPGQQEHIEPPMKGKGTYRRNHERRETDEEIDELPAGEESPPEPPADEVDETDERDEASSP